MYSSKQIILLSSLVLALASCNPYNNYVSPPLCCPPDWKEDHVYLDPPPEVENWWDVFNDCELSELEERAVTNNRDIEIAYYRMRESAAISRVAFAQLFPQIGFDPFYSKTDQLTNFTGIPDVSTFRLRQEQYTLPIDGFVPFDIWNELGLNWESAREEAQAKCRAWQWVMLSVTNQVANTYFAIRTLDAELKVIETNIHIRQNQVEITTARYEAGLVNFADVSRAQTEVTNARAEYEDTLRMRTVLENALATLIGEPAPVFEMCSSPITGTIPEIPTSIPCEIVVRRADILEAERIVAATHDQVGVAWAGFLPSASFTGSIGYSSPNFTDLLTWKSRFWSYMYNVSQVLFDGGALIANFKAATAAYYTAISEYYRRILIGFQEVEDALAEIKYRALQEEQLMLSVESSTITFNLSQLRYENGLVDYLDVVDAERTMLETQRAEVRAYGAQFIATAQLIKALGGTW
jgi:multidrug efflux system outer membrane protein